jgi:outer membrane protein
MGKRIFTLLIFISLLSANSYSQQTEKWTLENCIAFALGENTSIQNQKLNIESRELDFNRSKLDRLPNLNGSIGWFLNFGRSIDPTTNVFTTRNTNTSTFNLNSNVTLFAAGQINNTIKKNALDVEASKKDLEYADLQVKSSITNSYLRVLLAKSSLQVAQEQLEISEFQLENTKKLAEAGRLPEGNVLEFEAQVAQTQLIVTQAENELSLSLIALQQAMNKFPTLDFDIIEPNIQVNENLIDRYESPDILYQKLLDSHPDILAQMLRVESADKSILISRSAQYPSLTLSGALNSSRSSARSKFNPIFGGFDTIGTVLPSGDPVLSNNPSVSLEEINYPYMNQLGDNFYQNVGVTLRIPIFNRGQVNNNIGQAEIIRKQADILLTDRKYKLRNDVYNAYYYALTAGKKYVASRNSAIANRKSFEYIQKKYEQGLIQPLEFNTAQNNLLIAEANLIKAKYDYLLGIKLLDILLGRPITLE